MEIPKADDPRHFVIVEPVEGKTLVYWGTPRVKATVEPTTWPQVYRERSERQENSFKRMIDHGALNTNYGRKKIPRGSASATCTRAPQPSAGGGPEARGEAESEVKTQQAKVVESASKGHGKRLEQRQHTLAVLDKAHKDAQHKQGQLAVQAAAVGPPGERADRDFRKQTIMTVRTLLLENALMSFMAVLLGFLKTQVSLDCLLKLLFERSGARIETATQVVYWVNTAGLSVPYYRLAEVVDGLCAMDLRDQGKPIHVRLKQHSLIIAVPGQIGCPFLERLSEVRGAQKIHETRAADPGRARLSPDRQGGCRSALPSDQPPR